MVEPGDGAIGGEETGGQVLGRAAHLGADVQLADVARAVRLPQHAVDVLGEVMELEAEVKVHELSTLPVSPYLWIQSSLSVMGTTLADMVKTPSSSTMTVLTVKHSRFI